MPLESLYALVEKLRQRIQSHRSLLSGSEWLTRYTLIDPLLRELGWDTEDPELVIPEYSSGGGRADYALISNGHPAVIVEAKKLGEPLSLSVISQVLNYCLIEGTAHFAMTDGRRWEIYETHKPVPISEKQVVSFDLLDTSPSDVCLKALALWRQNIASGQVGTAHTPVVSSDDAPDVVQQPAPPVVEPPTQPTPLATLPTAVAYDNEEWVPLTEFQPSESKPTEIIFPDSSSVPIRAWTTILVAVTRWLSNAGYLNESNCPITLGQDRYIVNTQNVHPNGSSYGSWERVNSLWVEKHGSGQQIIKNAQTVIQHVGQDPSQFKVRW